MSEKLLVVDDQFGIRVLLTEVFTQDGYTTFDAANGQKALDLLESEEPDLVLLDMKIPGMDGIEILREMRHRNIQTDVFLMTAYGEMELIQEAKSLGAMEHFSKPFDIDSVRHRVRSFFDEKAKM
ncbi:response regulator [Alkalicoccus daliensis]|uniref:Two-component system, response regulator, stage 0 sporulation protein F n=1 Tax=Alkalicoccus daliensis TaxID=745820 RepID=A0A1H0KDT0_9BACI|nr:response regulator [Alkalicoccus daliensis]SDO53901.1 two-component system, response regulator, stage 0 sporulation protein F [Alkalicoccus daliensis]